MLVTALTTGATDVGITIALVSAAAVLIAGVDRFPPTRYLLDRLDPSRAWARHPSAGPPTPTGTVRRIPRADELPGVELPAPIAFFDYERHA